jgi:hypothetical protein
MIPEIAIFWVISTALVLQGVTIAARDQQKIRQWIFFIESAKEASLIEMS